MVHVRFKIREVDSQLPYYCAINEDKGACAEYHFQGVDIRPPQDRLVEVVSLVRFKERSTKWIHPKSLAEIRSQIIQHLDLNCCSVGDIKPVPPPHCANIII